MNETINKFLLASDKFMPKMHRLLKTKEAYKKIKKKQQHINDISYQS